MTKDLRQPGVSVSVSGEGLPAITEASPAQGFLAGEMEWGRPNTPVFIGGLADFRREFGGQVPYSLAATAYEHALNLSNGALRAWVSRVFFIKEPVTATVKVAAAGGTRNLVLDDLGDLAPGDHLQIAGTNGAEIATVNAGLKLVTLVNPLTVGVNLNDTISRPGDTYLDYSATCLLNNTDGVGELEQVAAAPGAKGNTFLTEVVPGGTNAALDRTVRSTCRNLSFTFEWRGVPAKPTVVAEGNEGYADYLTELAAWNIVSEIALAANAETLEGINAQAEELGIDFSLRIPESSTGAPLAVTGAKLGYRLSPDAFTWAGGSNGAALDALPLSASVQDMLEATPDSAFTGTIYASGKRTGLKAFADRVYGAGAVLVPGRSSEAIWAAIDEHANEFDRLGLLAFPREVTDMMAAYELKKTRAVSKLVAAYYPWFVKDGAWCSMDALALGVGARETARQDEDGGIKASWTGPVAIDGISQRGGFDAVRDTEAEFLYRDDIRINWVKLSKNGYRLESQKLAIPQGATSRVSHTVCNNVFVHSIEPVLEYVRDRPIGRDGKLINDVIETVEGFLTDYGPGKPGPRGDTFWDAAFLLDATSTNDLNTYTLRAEGGYSFNPQAERVFVNFKQYAIGKLS